MFIIEAALTYDMVIFREERGFATGIINKTFKIDIKEMFPELKDKKIESKIKDINYKQEQKQHRKTDFKQKHKCAIRLFVLLFHNFILMKPYYIYVL